MECGLPHNRPDNPIGGPRGVRRRRAWLHAIESRESEGLGCAPEVSGHLMIRAFTYQRAPIDVRGGEIERL